MPQKVRYKKNNNNNNNNITQVKTLTVLKVSLINTLNCEVSRVFNLVSQLKKSKYALFQCVHDPDIRDMVVNYCEGEEAASNILTHATWSWMYNS